MQGRDRGLPQEGEVKEEDSEQGTKGNKIDERVKTEQDSKPNKSGIKYIWEKNWEIPVFILAVIIFLILIMCFSSKKGFYIPTFGNDTNDTLAIADDNNCDGMFLRDGLDALKTEFPKDTNDTDVCKEKYKKVGNILWIDKRYIGVGFFSYLIVIDTKYHTETRDCLERVSVWKRVSMGNPRTEEELNGVAVELLGK